jgi:hypothetical protein
MAKLLGQYKAMLYSPDGEFLAQFENFRRLEIVHLINGVDRCTMTIEGQDDRLDYFTTNAILEIWRKIPGYTPSAVPAERLKPNGWYVEWEGLQSDIQRTVFRNGDEQAVMRLDGFLDLVSRREVMWYATKSSSESKKVSIAAQTAIHEFVEENCGAQALATNGRFIDGAIDGFSVATSDGEGPVWSGARAYRKVLDVIANIGDYASIDFNVVGIGDGNFEFRTYVDQLGKDRTTNGLDSTTGKNGAGNAPVTFSLSADNIEQITYKTERRASVNVVCALGKNQYTSRDYNIQVNAAEIDDRRINQREATRNCNTQDDANELQISAREWIETKKAREDFTFVPLITPSTVYGVHYWWGDKMTARFKDIIRDKRLVGLKIVVDENIETFQNWSFQTIPRD